MPLASIWAESAAFTRFRGTSWLPEPCRDCPAREVDFGGCRCQAYQLTGDAGATDPVCQYSPRHPVIDAAIAAAAATPSQPLTYRTGPKRIRSATGTTTSTRQPTASLQGEGTSAAFPEWAG
jgi:PqqA peptide cyclase